MPAKAKLTDEQVKRIRRRVRAGERISDLAVEYDVNRKTIRPMPWSSPTLSAHGARTAGAPRRSA